MSIDFPRPSDDLTFLTPLSEERAARLVAFLTGGRPVRVLDVGCGWGELLVRVLEAAPQALGLGLDLDADSVEQATARAVRRDVAHRVDFEVRDAHVAGGTFDAVTCIGASQIWGPPVEATEPLPYEVALAALRDLVPRGGRVVHGEGFWSSPPTPDATAPLAGRPRPDAVQVRELATRQRADYYGGYRGVLGLAYLHLLAV